MARSQDAAEPLGHRLVSIDPTGEHHQDHLPRHVQHPPNLFERRLLLRPNTASPQRSNILRSWQNPDSHHLFIALDILDAASLSSKDGVSRPHDSRRGFRERKRIANPLFVGSNPTSALQKRPWRSRRGRSCAPRVRPVPGWCPTFRTRFRTRCDLDSANLIVR